ncbi:MAG: hypothetical protein ABIJ40_03375 [Bacteroidota bacterium]
MLTRITVMQLILMITILGIGGMRAQTIPDEENLLSPENRLQFGEYLFCQKDYLRAADEFKEYLKYSNNDTIRFKIAYSFDKLLRHSEARDNYKSLFFNSNLSEEAKLHFLSTYFVSGEFQKFKEFYADGVFLPAIYSAETRSINSAIDLFDDELPSDSARLINSFPQFHQDFMRDFYFRKQNQKYLDPQTAALLSAAIPGLGKIYSNEIGDGITSFVFTAVLGALAASNFNSDHTFRAWLFTGLTAYFYAGNIYGSYSAAQSYNAQVKFQFKVDLKNYIKSLNYFLPNINFLCN